MRQNWSMFPRISTVIALLWCCENNWLFYRRNAIWLLSRYWRNYIAIDLAYLLCKDKVRIQGDHSEFLVMRKAIKSGCACVGVGGVIWLTHTRYLHDRWIQPAIIYLWNTKVMCVVSILCLFKEWYILINWHVDSFINKG